MIDDLRSDARDLGAERIGELLDAAERLGIRRLGFDELRELGRLYRLHSARLAEMRDREDDPDEIRRLNAQCVRAYSHLYGSSPRRPSGGRSAERIADAVARTWRPLAVSFALLFIGIGVGGSLASRDPEALYAFVPSSLGYTGERLERLLVSPEARAAFLEGSDPDFARSAAFGSQLFVHNTRVGLLAFASGMLAGLPTIVLGIYNGIVIGALSSVFADDPVPYLAWILPHGVPELSAVCLCSAGGLVLGMAMAAPGRRGRRRALKEDVTPALALFLCAIPLLAVAALIESFVRESDMGLAPRFAVAGVCAGGVALSLWLVRRVARRRAVDTSWLRDLAGRGP